MHIRKLFFCLVFACSVAHAGDTLSVTFARLDSLVKAINMLYHLYPDTTNLSTYTTPIMSWNGTKWVVSSGLTVTLGTASFDHFATRKAVYISGAAASDYCFIVGIGDGATLPFEAMRTTCRRLNSREAWKN